MKSFLRANWAVSMDRRVAVAAMTFVVLACPRSPAAASPYRDAVLASSPIAYYRLNETEGTVAANSGTAESVLDGLYVNFDEGASNPQSLMGVPGPRPGDLSETSVISGFEANNFAIHSAANGNAQVDVLDHDLLDITGALTLEAWIYRDANTGGLENEGIVGKFQGRPTGINERSYDLYYNTRPQAGPFSTPSIGFTVNPTGVGVDSITLEPAIEIPIGEEGGWFHIAATYEPGTRMAIYVNGDLAGERFDSVPAAIHSGAAPLWIGRQFNPATTTNAFEGKIDEVAIYNTALSAETILTHYQAAFLDAPPLVPGDFNGDANVDGADFVIWQTNFPNNTGEATLALGDANGDGNVDGADFVIWQTNFPTIAGGATPVPEPTTCLQLLAGMMAAVAVRRRVQVVSHSEI